MKGYADPTVVIRRSRNKRNQSGNSGVGNPAYVKAKWKFIEWNTLLVVIQGSMRPESMSCSIVDPAIYSSVLQRLEYPIFGAIHRELLTSFYFCSILTVPLLQFAWQWNVLKLGFIVAILSGLCTAFQVNEIN